MQKRLFGAIAIAVVLVFAGCDEEPSVADKIKTMEDNGELPKLDRSSSLAGTDANNNGVRDDVEAFINKTYTEEKQRKAAMQFAATSQAVLLIDYSDKTAAKNSARTISLKDGRAQICVIRTFDKPGSKERGGLVWRKIEAMTYNTSARQKAYFEYNHLRNGTTWSLPKGDTCE